MVNEMHEFMQKRSTLANDAFSEVDGQNKYNPKFEKFREQAKKEIEKRKTIEGQIHGYSYDYVIIDDLAKTRPTNPKLSVDDLAQELLDLY